MNHRGTKHTFFVHHLSEKLRHRRRRVSVLCVERGNRGMANPQRARGATSALVHVVLRIRHDYLTGLSVLIRNTMSPLESCGVSVALYLPGVTVA